MKIMYSNDKFVKIRIQKLEFKLMEKKNREKTCNTTVSAGRDN